MLNLITIEMYKVLHRKNTYVYFFIILAISTLFAIVFSQEKANEGSMLPITLLSGFDLMIFPVLTVVFLTQLFSSEIRDGTIKILLTRPVARTKLLIAKLTVLAFFVCSLYLFTFIASYSLAFVFSGFHHFLELENGWLLFIESVYTTLIAYALSFLPMFAFGVTMTTASLLIKIEGLMISLGLGVTLLMSIAGDYIPKIRPYLITSYFNGADIFLASSLGIEDRIVPWIVVLSYILFSFLLSSAIFTRKDVEA